MRLKPGGQRVSSSIFFDQRCSIMRSANPWVFTALLVALPASVFCQGLPQTSPEQVGLSSERLARIGAVMQAHVDEGRIAGAVGLVARNGKVAYLQSWGMRDMGRAAQMETDAIFRIYSMTKPITSVAVMMLFEEGRFLLSDPVGRYLPELSGVEVAVPPDSASGERTTRRTRPITIRDLLRHTSGLSYGFFSDTYVDTLYRQAGVLYRDSTLAQMVTTLGDIPLLYEPGTRWHYSVSTDVLARLVEVVSGMPVDEFFHERILDPLGMHDTEFYVDESRRDRFARMYQHDGDGNLMPGDSTQFLEKPSFLSGGGGLTSTASDYVRFAQMLLNGGELDGVRLLGRKTVELMTANHLDDGQRVAAFGFGLGVSVRRELGADGAQGSLGEYGWGGLAGTTFWVDPEEELVGVFMVHINPNRDIDFRNQFKNLVYQAITN
jgi:CubicO group peptidase (beta-lactamase class C family)